MYIYGMKLRGFSPGCQPLNGLVNRQEDVTGKYYDLLIYDRELTQEEERDYELELMEVVHEKREDFGNDNN